MGDSVGACDGLGDGECVVGVSVGVEVGAVVGLKVGAVVGLKVETSATFGAAHSQEFLTLGLLGAAVGKSVGTLLGAAVGELLGVAVGELLGGAVGCVVPIWQVYGLLL